MTPPYEESVDEISPLDDRVVMELPTANFGEIPASSDSEITRTTEKSDTQISAFNVSDYSGNEFGSLGIPCEPVVEDSDGSKTPSRSSIALNNQIVAVGCHRFNQIVDKKMSDEELEQGFRLESKPDPKYLGFLPSSRDKRKYLSAIALDGPAPGNTWQCYMPITIGQRLMIIAFFILFGLAAAGVVLFLRSTILNAPGSIQRPVSALSP